MMWNQAYRKNDAEAGARPLYPTMLEPPEIRWASIRKVYSIVAIQLLATIAVAATVVTVRPIAHFFVSSGAGLALYIVLIVTPFIDTKHFVNGVNFDLKMEAKNGSSSSKLSINTSETIEFKGKETTLALLVLAMFALVTALIIYKKCIRVRDSEVDVQNEMERAARE